MDLLNFTFFHQNFIENRNQTMVLPLKLTGVDSSPSNAGNPAISGAALQFFLGGLPISSKKSWDIPPMRYFLLMSYGKYLLLGGLSIIYN